MSKFLLLLLVTWVGQDLHAAARPFDSHLFKNGTLIYSDDFAGTLDRKRWQPRTKSWEVKDGVLVGTHPITQTPRRR